MRTLEQALRWIAIAGAFLLPFIVFYVAGNLFFPFITGKNFTFRILVEVMAAAWLGLALILPQYRPRKNWTLAAFAAFVLIMAIADAQGANPLKSFWSNFERMDGWVTLAHLFVYLVVVVSVLNTEKLWRWLFRLSLAVSAGVGYMGLQQLLGWTQVGQGGVNGLSGRIDATFGNAIYLAVYDLFNVFFAALLWVQEWRERKPGKRMWISILYGSVILFDTVILLFTGTRGATLGLIGGAILAAIIYVFREENVRQARIYVAGVLAFLVVLAVGLHAVRDTQQVKDVAFLVRLANISLNDATFQTRLMNIGMAWKGIQERPILGWGQEHYAIVFDKFYNPGMYNAEPWFDRVHNTFFDIFVAGGLLGLLAYLSIFLTALAYLWRSKAFRIAESSILIGLLVGYFFQNLTVFDNATSYLLFATVLGYIIWRESEARKAPHVVEGNVLPLEALTFAAIGSVLVIGAIGWWTNAPGITQNMTLIRALIDASQGKYDLALHDFQVAASINSIGTQEVREQLAQAAAQFASSQASEALKQQYRDTAIREMTTQMQLSPLDARFPLFLGLVYQAYGDLENARKAFEKAHELSPTKQSIDYQLGQNALSRGDAPGAFNAFKAAYEVDTTNVDAALYYASLLIRANQDTLADQVLAPLIVTGQAADQRISEAYKARGRFDKIAAIWEAKTHVDTENKDAYFTLSAAYLAAGNTAKSLETLRTVSQKIPAAASEAQKYIEQIKSGALKK